MEILEDFDFEEIEWEVNCYKNAKKSVKNRNQ